jgi:hypothetical protein
MNEPEDIVAIPPFMQGVMAGMRQAIRQKWNEAAMTFFARAIINKDVAVACGEAGFSEAMIFHRNKAAWLLAQAMECLAHSARFV